MTTEEILSIPIYRRDVLKNVRKRLYTKLAAEYVPIPYLNVVTNLVVGDDLNPKGRLVKQFEEWIEGYERKYPSGAEKQVDNFRFQLERMKRDFGFDYQYAAADWPAGGSLDNITVDENVKERPYHSADDIAANNQDEIEAIEVGDQAEAEEENEVPENMPVPPPRRVAFDEDANLVYETALPSAATSMTDLTGNIPIPPPPSAANSLSDLTGNVPPPPSAAHSLDDLNGGFQTARGSAGTSINDLTDTAQTSMSDLLTDFTNSTANTSMTDLTEPMDRGFQTVPGTAGTSMTDLTDPMDRGFQTVPGTAGPSMEDLAENNNGNLPPIPPRRNIPTPRSFVPPPPIVPMNPMQVQPNSIPTAAMVPAMKNIPTQPASYQGNPALLAALLNSQTKAAGSKRKSVGLRIPTKNKKRAKHTREEESSDEDEESEESDDSESSESSSEEEEESSDEDEEE